MVNFTIIMVSITHNYGEFHCNYGVHHYNLPFKKPPYVEFQSMEGENLLCKPVPKGRVCKPTQKFFFC
jgi:hypothetical protein